LSSPAEMARMSAAMFTVSYSEALVVSVVSGSAWDIAGNPRFAFLPIAMSGLPLIFIPPAIFSRVQDVRT
jgi:MFS transporter, CP family, cyanate transporter